MIKLYVSSIICLIYFNAYSQTSFKLTDSELEEEKVFYSFKNYIIKCIKKNEDLNDSAHCKHILLNYILSDNKLDSTDTVHFNYNEIPNERMKEFVSEIGAIYQYFYESKDLQVAEHLSITPIRYSSDKWLSNKLTSFQRSNTFMLFDDRYPNKVLSYVLFAPTIPNKLNRSRIWAWTLEFKYGLWAFRSPMGLVGTEYLMSDTNGSK